MALILLKLYYFLNVNTYDGLLAIVHTVWSEQYKSHLDVNTVDAFSSICVVTAVSYWQLWGFNLSVWYLNTTVLGVIWKEEIEVFDVLNRLDLKIYWDPGW